MSCVVFLLLPDVFGAIQNQIDFAPHGGRKRREHAVVVPLGQGIVFVIVATAAADRQAEHRRAEIVDDVIQFVIPRFLDFIGGNLGGVYAGSQIARRFQGEIVLRFILVAGKLPFHKGVVGKIAIESFDDEVTVVVGGGAVVVLLVTVAFRESCQVEPEPGPAFAVPWTGHSPVYQSLVCVRPLIFNEGSDLVGCWGQTN